MIVSFADFTADFDAHELRRGETRVHLSPKAFRLLELLITNRARALSKAELQEALWPDVFVQESNLADLVSELRGALEQTGQRQGLIRTVHGFGYAFSGTVQTSGGESAPAAGPASWRLTWRDGHVALGEGEFAMGRDPEATVYVDEPTVSWQHASLRINGTGAASRATLTDLSSSNGTYVNGTRLTDTVEVKHGDDLRLGQVRIALRQISKERSPTQPMEPPPS